ncbi:MAG: carbamoyltransferase C-terminal domain-containing protein [Planctomycetota bacterium]|jgi:carbamoyltransferase|nr:carbamoyltransferase C-terminal domain-containing protein [Planctomycetota bacterium]
MIVLGIFAFGMNPGACLLRDGELVAFGEEERFTRLKGSHGVFPGRAAVSCLVQAGINLGDVDRIAFAWDASKYPYRMLGTIGRQFLKYRGKVGAPSGAKSQRRGKAKNANALSVLLNLLKFTPRRLLEEIRLALRATGYRGELPPIEFVPHHLSHAYSAYYTSPFDEALVLTLDGSGEDTCTQITHGEGDDLRGLSTTPIPHSLGWYYAAFTAYMGFLPYRHEGKLMALAGLGHARAADNPWPERLRNLLSTDGDSYTVDPTFTRFGSHSHAERFTDKLVEFITGYDSSLRPLGPMHAADHGRLLQPAYVDLAWGVQRRLEEVVGDLARSALREHPTPNICLAGGVALNCKMNGSLLGLNGVERVFAFPASNDAGSSIGAAMVVAHRGGDRIKRALTNAHLGPEFSDGAVRDVLRFSKVPFSEPPDIVEATVTRLARGEAVGWFQGRMELGPRALGARSILADPRRTDASERLNREVKAREIWRPFCPSILSGHEDELVGGATNADFMTVALPVREQSLAAMEQCRHADGTTRPQVVREEVHPRYHALLRRFEGETGTPFLINTSFNVSGEPIVCTPAEALRSFYSCGLDALAIGSFLVEK